MTNNNVQNVKFLRNGSLFATREAARTALETNKSLGSDGSAILARYSGGTTGGEDFFIKTLVGFVYSGDSGNFVTIIDVDDAGTDAKAYVDSLVGTGITSANTATAQLEALSGSPSDSSATTSVAGAKKYTDDKIAETINGLDVAAISAPAGAFIKSVSQADGKVSATTEDMPTVAIQTETGKPIIAVSQTKGTLAASAGTINAQYVNISDSGSLITATDVEGALAEIATEIDAMDLTQVGDGNGKVIIAVSEQDGKVSASATSVSDLTLEGFEANAATTGAVTSADTIEAAINKLENKAAAITIANADKSINVTTGASGTDINVNIKSGEHVLAKDGSNGIYTNISLSSITPSSTTVKEEYQLTATDGTKLGDTIKIYKDSSIVEIYLGTSGDSVDATSGVITKLDGDKQYLNYVYLDANGNYQITKVNISVFITEQEFASGVTFDSTENKVKGVVDSTSEGFLTVGADGFKLSGVQDAIGTAISGLDVSDSAVAGQYVSQVSETDGKIAVVRANVSEAVLNNYAKGSDSGAVASTDTINQAISKLENKIDSKVNALDATVSGQTADGKVKVQVVQENGVLTAVTVTGTDIASDSALTAEITARKAVDGQTGQTYAKNTSSPYISGATDLNDADIKLAAALKVADDAMLTGVTAGNGIHIEAKANKSQTISAKVNGDGGIENDATGLHLGTIDCGTY